MSVYSHVDGLGVVLETCIADSVLQWRREHKPRRRTVDTIAEHLHNVTTTVMLRPAGVVLITVQCEGRSHLEHTTECFRAQRTSGGRWNVTASSLRSS